MLESMIDNPRPTRAEASDVANAIYDGTDSVMLSAETAAGKYPVEAVAMMAKIITETEHQIRIDPPPALGHHPSVRLSIAETICECMSHAADDLDVAAIAIFTESGATARLLSKYPPDPPIFALSPFENVINRCMLLWGTYPILCARFHDTDKLVKMAEHILELKVTSTSVRSSASSPAPAPNPAPPTSCASTWSAIGTLSPSSHKSQRRKNVDPKPRRLTSSLIDRSSIFNAVLNAWIARSCSSAFSRVANVPRFLRRPVFGA